MNLLLPKAQIAVLENDKFSNETIEAQMTWGTLTNLPVKVRNRGRWSRSWNKTPLKVFLPNNPVENRECLNLNSTYRDPSWIRERLAYHVYSIAGVPASKTRFIELRLNSKFHGIYVEVEQVDSDFLKSRGFKGAEAYKANGGRHASDERRLKDEAAYRGEYEKQTKGKTNYTSLIDFCAALNAATDVDKFFQERVDLDRYISYLAATILTQNWDALNKNHVLVHDAANSGKWFVVPWDVDRTFGDWPGANSGGSFNMYRLPVELGIQSSPGVTGWNRLQDRFWKSKPLRLRLARRLEELLATEFTLERLNPVIDAWAAEIKPGAVQDRTVWGSASELDLTEGIRELKAFIKKRREFVLAGLAQLKE
ncbi:MAG TPA: CotH kinase family protein [Verrucomicrobiota bacterium]|nr:CotH kinase family protein [Verrucomicrobiota bacterium]